MVSESFRILRNDVICREILFYLFANDDGLPILIIYSSAVVVPDTFIYVEEFEQWWRKMVRHRQV